MDRRRPTPENAAHFSTDAKVIEYHSQVVQGLEPYVARKIDGTNGERQLLLPVETIWQPSRWLPESSVEDEFIDQIRDLRKEARQLPQDLVVVLIGADITEEGLPLFMTWLNRFPAVSDKSGTDQSAWARWIRKWTAEEHRHEFGLNKYLYLSGLVEMVRVERTTHNFIANGFNPGVGSDPYRGLFYVAFQEEATEKFHKNGARLARQYGAKQLGQLWGAIGGDEDRHKQFYQGAMGEVFLIDREGALITMRDMMKMGIVMPGALMSEDSSTPVGETSALYEAFTAASSRIGVYGLADYVAIFEHLVNDYDVEHLSVAGEAAKAQHQVMVLLQAHKRMVNREPKAEKQGKIIETYPWLS